MHPLCGQSLEMHSMHSFAAAAAFRKKEGGGGEQNMGIKHIYTQHGDI